MLNERRSPQEFLSRFPLRASEMVQIGRGSLDLHSVEIWGRSLFIIDVRSRPRTTWTILSEPDWFGFVVPLWWEGDYVLNRHAARPGNVFLVDGHDEYAGTFGKRRTVIFGVQRRALERACAGLSGRPDHRLPNGHRIIETSVRQTQGLRALVWKLSRAASDRGLQDGRLLIPPTFEIDAISTLADWLVTIDAAGLPAPVQRHDNVRIVEAAKVALRDNPGARVAVADLCSAVGVGKSRLHQAFVDVHGISPGNYILKQRINEARKLLRYSATRPQSVKDVALQLGFVSSGRFAETYSKTFGEFPSEALVRPASPGARSALWSQRSIGQWET